LHSKSKHDYKACALLFFLYLVIGIVRVLLRFISTEMAVHLLSLLLLLVLLLHSASAATDFSCVTGVAEISGADIHLSSCGASVWHSNHRTVLAASLVTSGTEVALLCSYADNTAEVRLERYSLADGSYRDGVALARSAALPPPATLCLTTYDAFLIEADGALAHYSRIDGSAKPIAAETAGGALAVSALACTNTRMFGIVNGSIIAELDPADALALRVVARLPAIAALSLYSASVLQVQLGEPPVFVLLLDFDTLSAHILNKVSYSVSTSGGGADAACVINTLDAAHGVISASSTQYWAQCAQLSDSIVLGEDTVWAVQRGSGLPTAIGGELGNNGNLGSLVAAHGAPQQQLAIVDEAGRVGVVQLNACDAGAFVRHVHSLTSPSLSTAAARITVYELNNASLLWGVGTTQYVRVGGIDSADVELPPLGGAVFDGTVVEDMPCLLMASQVHCVNVETRAISANIPLTQQMKDAVQALNLVNDGRDVAVVYTDSRHRRIQAVRHNGVDWQRACAVAAAHSDYEVQVVDATAGSGYVLRTAAGELRELFLANCTSRGKATLSTSAVLLSEGLSTTAVALLYADSSSTNNKKKQQQPRCIFVMKKHSKPSAALVPLVVGALALCCCAAMLIGVCIVYALDVHKTSEERTRFPPSHRRRSSAACCPELRNAATDEKAKNVVFLACCCWPFARQHIHAWQDKNRFKRLSDGEDDGASLSTFSSAGGGGGGSSGALSLMADTPTDQHSSLISERAHSPAAAAALAAAAAVAASESPAAAGVAAAAPVSSSSAVHMAHVSLE
jgi:hypothetical protein